MNICIWNRVAQVVEYKVGNPENLGSILYWCSFNWTAFNYLRNNTDYLPTLATIITIYKIRIANLDLRSWQSPIWKYLLFRGKRVHVCMVAGKKYLPTYAEYRLQSCVWRLPKYWPPTPSPPSEWVLPPHQRWGVHTRRVVRGPIFWKTPDIRLASYSIISLRSQVKLNRKNNIAKNIKVKDNWKNVNYVELHYEFVLQYSPMC